MKQIPPKETRFKKGVSGNSKGRPKLLPELKDAITDALNVCDRKNRTALQRILAKLVDRAIRGDTRAAELLLDRTFGRPRQDIATLTPIINIESADAELRKTLEEVDRKLQAIDDEFEMKQSEGQ